MGRHSEENELSETSSFLPQHIVATVRTKSRLNRAYAWIRIFLCITAVTVNLAAVVVLVRFMNGSPDFGGDVNHITPTFSKELLKFSPALDYYTLNYTSKEEARIMRERWQDMLPKGGGDVHIPNHEKYEHLSEPWVTPSGVTLWKVSWAHQIHCLYYIMDAYDRVVRYGVTGEENKIKEGHHSVHTKHCYDYLRQAILCNSDMTLEGRTVFDNTGGTDGYGHLHVCRNRNEVVQWAEDHRVKDRRFIIDADAPL